MLDMKRLFLLCMALGFLITANAQGRGKWTEEEMLEMLEDKVATFCKYIGIVGSTRSGVSVQEKEAIINNSLWGLFYRYKERSMITTRGWNGKILNKSKMKDYFVALKDQSLTGFRKEEVSYDLKFDFVTSGGQLKWKYKKTNEDGTKEYTAEVLITQVYIKEMRNGSNEIIQRKREEDKKTMECTKIVYPDNETLIALGDITKAVRISTSI